MSNEMIQTALADKQLSKWFRQALESALKCDLFTATEEAVLLHELLSRRYREAMDAKLKRVAQRRKVDG